MINYGMIGSAAQMSGSPLSLGGSSGAGGAAAGMGGMDYLGMGMQLLGGWLSQRNQRKESRMERQQAREQMMAQRAAQREGLIGSLFGTQADMQTRQDDYARTIMRNRAAIAPYAEMYSGPKFTTADPNAPIFNPLTEEGHIYGQIGGWRQGLMDNPVAPPPTMQHPWRG